MALNLFFKGGLVFVDPLRKRNCMTMLDPFQHKYGKVITAMMSMGSLCLDVIWVPTTLTGLGIVLSTVGAQCVMAACGSR